MATRKKAPSPGDQVERVFNRLQDPKTKVLSYDTETSGLDWRRNHLVGYVLAFGPSPDDTNYLPVRHAAGGNIGGGKGPATADGWDQSPHLVDLELARIIRSRGKDLTVIGHNLAFDLRFSAKHGILFEQSWLEDTMVNQGLLDENSARFDLDSCCTVMRVPVKKTAVYQHLADKFGGEPDRKQIGNFWRLSGDDPVGVEYAAGDGTSTYCLWAAQQGVLDLEDLRRVWQVECRNIRAAFRMSWRGIRVDEEQAQKVRKWVARRLSDARTALPEGFNVRAPSQIKKLFVDAGYRDDQFKTTGAGNLSFTEDWLETQPVGHAIVTVRKLENLDSSFLTPLLERHLYRGRVHPEFNQSKSDDFGTVTGRYSCSNPNMQQVHKRNEELGSVFRSIFVPDEGMVMASVDYNQIEPRLLAHYGNVRVLVEGYLADPPIDAHMSVALAAKIARQSGKTLNQALLTGAGDEKAAKMLKMPMDEAMAIVDAYFTSMPEIKPLQKRSMSVMRQRGYVRSLLGRRARLADQRFAYRALNRLLQCGNADIIKLAMAEIDEHLVEQGDTVHMLNTIHDDLNYQFFEEDRPVYERALAMMVDFGPGRPIELKIPMKVEAGEGPNWAIATYGAKALPYLAALDEKEPKKTTAAKPKKKVKA